MTDTLEARMTTDDPALSERIEELVDILFAVQRKLRYTIRDVIELCQELNGEILLEEESKQTPKQNYILELKKDEMLLERMMEKAAVAVPPEIREYKVRITEHLTKTVSVNGESWADAELKAREAYDRGEIVLSANDFAGVIFSFGG